MLVQGRSSESSSSYRGGGRSSRGWRPAAEQRELDQRRREEQQGMASGGGAAGAEGDLLHPAPIFSVMPRSQIRWAQGRGRARSRARPLLRDGAVAGLRVARGEAFEQRRRRGGLQAVRRHSGQRAGCTLVRGGGGLRPAERYGREMHWGSEMRLAEGEREMWSRRAGVSPATSCRNELVRASSCLCSQAEGGQLLLALDPKRMSRPLRGAAGVRTMAAGEAGGRTGMGVGRHRSRERIRWERKRIS
jgi:hypothetical protein